jgi:photosystem II stability/assembly factor-like uncharacterized protein
VRFGGELASATATTWVLAAFDQDNRPQLFRTTDGGRTWETAYHGDGEAVLNDLGFTNAQQGVVISRGADGAGRLLMTHDGGVNWTPVPLP